MGVIRSVFIAVLLLWATLAVQAQGKPEVHRINGNKYYLHVVEPGNTLYGISREYSVTIAEIQAENKEALKEGLKVNQTLLIPVTRENKRELPPVEQEGHYLRHVVQPGQTLYALSKKYDTSLDTLLHANPEVKEGGLRSGMEIRIPVAKLEVEQEFVAPAEPDSLEVHIVQKGETVYGIAQKYNVAQKDLILANGGLAFGLKQGMRIRIPGRIVESEIEEITGDSALVEDSIAVHVPDSLTRFNIGLLLPFEPKFPDSTEQFSINAASRVALSYYRGFHFAVDSMSKELGIGFQVRVFDVGRDSFALEEVLNSKAFKELDVAIGPFYNEPFERTADRCAHTGVPVICPVPKPSKLLFKRPNTIKTIPSTNMQINALAEYAAHHLTDSNVVLVNGNKMTDQENIEFFKMRYGKALGIPDTFAGEAIREVKLWDISNETLRMRFPDSGSYILLVPSNHAVFVSELLGELYDLHFSNKGKYRFRVIGLEEWYKMAEDIDIKYLHKLHVTLPLPQYIDLNDYRVNRFNAQYYQRFGHQPDQFATQGFDLATYLMRQLKYHPIEWFERPEDHDFHGVMEVYNFRRVLESSGVENQFIRFYEYDSYRLKEFARWPLQKKK